MLTLIVFCRNHDAASFSSKFATPKYQSPLAFWFYRNEFPQTWSICSHWLWFYGICPG